jgi:hypothetical protein
MKFWLLILLQLVAVFFLSCEEDRTQHRGWKTFTTSNSTLPGNIISEITVDDNGVAWLGVENYLVWFDGKSFTRYKFADTPDVVQAIYVDGHDNKWLDARSGLYKFDNTSFEKFAAVAGLFVEKDTLWTVRGNQLEKIQISTGATISCTVAYDFNDGYYELKKDLKGRYLAGTTQYRYTKQIQLIKNDFCSTSTTIVPDLGESEPKLTISPDSLIYFTTGGSGLGIIKKDMSYELLHPWNGGLPSNWTLDIAVEGDGSKVWVAYTSLWFTPEPPVPASGLVEYSPNLGVVNVYDTSNSGLADDTYISAVAVMKNKVLAGTLKGLSVLTR